MRGRILVVLMLAGVGVVAQQRPAPSPQPVAIEQAMQSDMIFRAAFEEVRRTKDLRLLMETPFFVDLGVEDAETYLVSATFGSVLTERESRLRPVRAMVRVGTPQFDNTGSIYSEMYSGSRMDPDGLPLDDHFLNLRRVLWLKLDRAYKTAAEAFGRKSAAIRGVTQTEPLADFWPSGSVVMIENVKPVKVDKADWRRRVRELSGVFTPSRELTGAMVEFQASQSASYYINTENTFVRVPDRVFFLQAKAARQAADGAVLYDGSAVVALDPADLKDEGALRAKVGSVAANLDRLAAAPKGETYTGPVLFEPEAAAQAFGEVFGSNLGARRRPVAEPGRAIPMAASELEGRLNARVLPEWMDVEDDPGLTSHEGRPVVGRYKVDLEGVAPQKLAVVEKGVLKTLLTTRQPVRGMTASNGRARLPGPFGTKQARISNLIVKAGEASALAELKARLVEEVKRLGKPYGLLVRKIDFPSQGSLDDLRALSQRAGRTGGRLMSAPVLVYKVMPDGTEQLVRGMRFRNLGARAFRDILAASKETAVFNYLDNGLPLALSGAGSYVVGCSVVSPGLLFEDLELEPGEEEAPKLPEVGPPPAE